MLSALLLAQALHAGLSIGAGTAYDGAGVRIEAGTDHLTGFGGLGVLAFVNRSSASAPGGFGFSAGVRGYLGARGGLFFSLNLTDALFSNFANYDLRILGVRRSVGSVRGRETLPGSVSTLTAVIGWRWRFGAGFIELGAGAGGYRERQPGGKPSYGPIPDGVLGLGFDL